MSSEVLSDSPLPPAAGHEPLNLCTIYVALCGAKCGQRFGAFNSPAAAHGMQLHFYGPANLFDYLLRERKKRGLNVLKV